MNGRGKTTSRDDRRVNAAVYLICTLTLVAVLYPLLFIFSASFSDPLRVIRGELVLWPVSPTLEGYKSILKYTGIWIGYRNTLFYTCFGTLINLAMTLPASYALSRRDFPLRGFMTLFFTITMFFGGGLIPTYLVVKSLNLINTPYVLVTLGAVSVWNTFIARTYFQSTIPLELQEAAYLDGCSTTKLFLRVVLPLSAPIVAVLLLFYAVGHWNSYFNALIYLSKMRLYP
ncbi:MAG TPA: carbohydrate ABC transporter permease, partial [Clostridia bacterium]|nr:carbohydrate ABC transporter permease [Clostridia bacterium]